ncbi:MAG: hypothetical protein QOJ13_944 [Gaiellales bacterium]|jgi:hypothetical protein|nr:hypothetical protein [Gaiellales bacterium]
MFDNSGPGSGSPERNELDKLLRGWPDRSNLPLPIELAVRDIICAIPDEFVRSALNTTYHGRVGFPGWSELERDYDLRYPAGQRTDGFMTFKDYVFKTRLGIPGNPTAVLEKILEHCPAEPLRQHSPSLHHAVMRAIAEAS